MSGKIKQTCLLALAIVGLVGCATSNTRNKVLRDMALGAVAGALVAQVKDHHRLTYATMYAGLGAATAGAVSVYLNVPQSDEIQAENKSLKQRIESFEKQLQPQLIEQGNSLFSSPMPKEVSRLVDPGEWKRYKLDQWVQDPNQSNTWYRQVEMFEIIPPVSR